MIAYFVGYCDEEGVERVTPQPYASRRDAEWYANFLHERLGYTDCHVREAHDYEGDVLYSDEIAHAAREVC